MDVDNSELMPSADFRAKMNVVLNELTEGEREKVVVTRYGKMEAVVLSVTTYEELTNAD
jgi:PHD/YefM family antitoxin component YafN of YafNO toxin-antitoxin module